MSIIKTLSNRIKSITLIKKVVFATKLVSASKLRNAKICLNASDIYMQTCKNIFSNTYDSYAYNIVQNYYKKNNYKIVVVIGTDKSLCGNFNNKLKDKIVNDICKGEDNIGIICIGNKLNNMLPKEKIIKSMPVSNRLGNHEYCTYISKTIFRLMSEYKPSSCVIIYTKYISTNKYKILVKKLFPLCNMFHDTISKKEFEFDGGKIFVLRRIVKLLFYSLILQAYTNSLTSEHCNRMFLTSNADKNSDKILKQMKNDFSKKRQLIITKDLIETTSSKIIINEKKK